LKKQLETAVKEVEGLKKYQDEMQKKYEDLEQKASMAPAAGAAVESQSHEDTIGNYRKARAVNQKSR